MAIIKHYSTKLRIEHHTITIHYLTERTFTSFTAAQLVPPGELRRYRQSKGRFCLSWKILVAKLNEICGGFDEAKHAVVYAQSPTFAAKVVTNEKGFNAAFREQIARFSKVEGGGSAVFWALKKTDLHVMKMNIAREAYLGEAGEDVAAEDGVGSERRRRVVETWSEAVERAVPDGEGVEENSASSGEDVSEAVNGIEKRIAVF